MVPADHLVEPESITCPLCHQTSYHPKDVQERYCGHCHQFIGLLLLSRELRLLELLQEKEAIEEEIRRLRRQLAEIP